MDWYSIHLETRAPDGTSDLTPDESAADVLMDLLAGHYGIVSSGAGSWSATVSMQAPGAPEAVISGAGLITNVAAKAGMPSWPTVRTEAVRQDVLDAENTEPTLPELVSAPEAGEILGVSPQRVHELAAGRPGFPDPVYELRTGKLWLRAAMEAFAQRWERKPGRPRKTAVATR